ncbi:hypothetical protein JI721_09905 [Alicyclobacillus cycloheptanicus]|uniref:Uncharacterized protein n=1 Tax=Alicyclobacillus cycloheptanicus TaxID=1457 RepID=A0ABT9XIS5_9BACL|nr:hypothetical protein [Alicyclobacillus cycloheptanicus]MDQ0190025.1 hypothetical protein [Alicyclobacillus cycloheptanicus]WDM00073.1 hypothetical protein JI721_09905 [Alicyclobacillus cycloheptanicus]
MQRRRRDKHRSNLRAALIGGILTTIDISTAILLLTGQLSTTGIFVYPQGLYVSVTGPIFNGQRLFGLGDGASAALDAVDVIVALLLILGELRVYGPFPGPHILSLTITGPPLGITAVPVPIQGRRSQQAEAFYRGFRQELLQRFAYREPDDR